MRWFEDGELNVSVNCLDRQLAERADKTALLFEGDDPGSSRAIFSYWLYPCIDFSRSCAPILPARSHTAREC